MVEDSIIPLIKNRGPDSCQTIHIIATPTPTTTTPTQHNDGENSGHTSSPHYEPLLLTFCGTVLHLRGDQGVTRQPIVNDHGDVLLWNGEIFGGGVNVSTQLYL